MKNLKLTLALACATAFLSCKKDEQFSSELKKFPNKVEKKMTLPGQGNLEAYLIPQANGTYKVAWGGIGLIFGSNMPHKIIDVMDGEPIQNYGFDGTFEYSNYAIEGAYFMVDIPQVGTSFNVSRQQLVAFKTAYDNFVFQTVDEFGSLKQPTFPNYDTYVQSTSNIIKGLVISSNASPSKMSVVPANYVPITRIDY